MSPGPLFLISALLHLYVGARVAPALPGGAAPAALFIALLTVCALLMPMTLFARRVRAQPWSDRLAWAGALAMGLFSSLFVLTLLRDALLLAATLVEAIAPGTLADVPLVHWSAAAVPLLGLAVTAWGFVNARRTAAVVSVDVPIAGLPAGLHGFTIVQISDIHGGQFLPWNLLVPMQQPFTAGLHRLRRLWVYTSRGTGYWGPPKRLGAPSEITRLRLVPQAG